MSRPACPQARTRFDAAAEELERLLVLKQGESITLSSVPHSGASGANPSKGRSFGKAMSKLKGPKNPAQFAKQEEDVRSRMGQSSDAYRAQVAGAQSIRQEYFNLQLPRILRVRSSLLLALLPLLLLDASPSRTRRHSRRASTSWTSGRSTTCRATPTSSRRSWSRTASPSRLSRPKMVRSRCISLGLSLTWPPR